MPEPKTGKERTQESYIRFLAYIDETGLDSGLREICRRHTVTLRDVYLAGHGPTVYAARLECWWWLVTTYGKSVVEIARFWDRDPSSIRYALRKLGDRANALGAELDASRVSFVVRTIAEEDAKALQERGRRVRSETLKKKGVEKKIAGT